MLRIPFLFVSLSICNFLFVLFIVFFLLIFSVTSLPCLNAQEFVTLRSLQGVSIRDVVEKAEPDHVVLRREDGVRTTAITSALSTVITKKPRKSPLLIHGANAIKNVGLQPTRPNISPKGAVGLSSTETASGGAPSKSHFPYPVQKI